MLADGRRAFGIDDTDIRGSFGVVQGSEGWSSIARVGTPAVMDPAWGACCHRHRAA